MAVKLKQRNGDIKLNASNGEIELTAPYKEVLPKLQEKTLKADPLYPKEYKPDEGYYGFSKITVERFLMLKSWTVNPEEETKTYKKNSPFRGVESFTVNGAPLQTKTVTPIEEAQTIEADEGYYGLKKVIVESVSNKVCEPYVVLQKVRTADNTGMYRYKYAFKVTVYGVSCDLIQEIAIGYNTTTTISSYSACNITQKGNITSEGGITYGVQNTTVNYGKARITYTDLDGNEQIIYSSVV